VDHLSLNDKSLEQVADQLFVRHLLGLIFILKSSLRALNEPQLMSLV
jgi:hypothetical protein